MYDAACYVYDAACYVYDAGVFESTHIVERGRIEPHKEATEDGGKYEQVHDISHAVTRHSDAVLLSVHTWSEGLQRRYRYIRWA